MASEAFRALEAFIGSAEVVRAATRSLTRAAEVALVLDGDEQVRFTMESGEPRLRPEQARDPDFTLRLPERAVGRITALRSESVGEYGVEFFSLALSKDPVTKIRIRIDAPTARLLGHGYLGVLASGGLKVSWWLLANGIKNPKTAIDRLRGAR